MAFSVFKPEGDIHLKKPYFSRTNLYFLYMKGTLKINGGNPHKHGLTPAVAGLPTASGKNSTFPPGQEVFFFVFVGFNVSINTLRLFKRRCYLDSFTCCHTQDVRCSTNSYILPSHIILTPGRPVLVCIPQCQAQAGPPLKIHFLSPDLESNRGLPHSRQTP